MEEKKIIIEVPPLLASCLQRMLVDEIENQQNWAAEELKEYGRTNAEMRQKIINQCEDLRNQLADKGVSKHFKC